MTHIFLWYLITGKFTITQFFGLVCRLTVIMDYLANYYGDIYSFVMVGNISSINISKGDLHWGDMGGSYKEQITIQLYNLLVLVVMKGKIKLQIPTPKTEF